MLPGDRQTTLPGSMYYHLTNCFNSLIGSRGLCRGFGYVTFVLAEDAKKAINDVKTFGGRQLSICFSDKKPKHEKRKHKQDEDDDDNREQQESASECNMRNCCLLGFF